MRRFERATSVLAVRLDGLGDLLMTTPALRALKEGAEGRRVTLLASPAGYAVARDLPFVDEVIAFRAPWVKGDGEPDDLAERVADLRERRFDGGVVFTVCTQNPLPAAMLLHLADVPLRAAYCRENPYALLTHWIPDPDRDLAAGVRHEVQRQLDLVAALGCPARRVGLEYPVGADARERVAAKARAAGLDPARPWIAFHPGATAPSRRYPVERFAAAAAELARDGRFQVVVAGSEGDRDAAELIVRTAPGARSLAGRLDLPELAALLARSRVLVCNNSGPAHLAAAVGTPVVDLYAQTNPQHAPWAVPHRLLFRDVPCRNCLRSVCPEGHHRCLAGVSPSAVVQAVRELAGASTLRPAADEERAASPRVAGATPC